MVRRLGPVVAVLAAACHSPQPGQQRAASQQDLIDLVPLVEAAPQVVARQPPMSTILPAPTGLSSAPNVPPFIVVHPVRWDQPVVSLPLADLEIALAVIDTQEQTLAELEVLRGEMTSRLEDLRGIIEVLGTPARLRAGLHACLLRRELEELAEMQHELHQDLIAARDEIAPTIQLAIARGGHHTRGGQDLPFDI